MKYGMALMYGYQSCEAGALKELKEMRRIVSTPSTNCQACHLQTNAFTLDIIELVLPYARLPGPTDVSR